MTNSYFFTEDFGFDHTFFFFPRDLLHALDWGLFDLLDGFGEADFRAGLDLGFDEAVGAGAATDGVKPLY